MNAESIFYALSAGVGFLELREGYRLLKTQGNIEKLDLSVGFLELVWLIVCLFSIFYLDLGWQGSLLSGAFIAYALVGILLAFMFIQHAQVQDEMEIQIPVWIIKMSVGWGAFYMLASTLLLFS